MCTKFCESKEDAEEVVQDTFLIAHKKADELQGDTLLAYLRKIAINLSFRKRKNNRQLREMFTPIENITEELVEIDANFLPEECLQNKETRTELLMIVDGLPKRQREMIYLYFFADYNTREIAELMECTVNNVHQTLYTAKNAIKSRLTKPEYATTKALVPFGAFLVLEEQAFVAGHGSTGTAAVTAAATAKGYVTAVCVAVACLTAVALYFVLTPEDIMPAEPMAYTVEDTRPQETPPPTVELTTQAEQAEPVPAEPEHTTYVVEAATTELPTTDTPTYYDVQDETYHDLPEEPSGEEIAIEQPEQDTTDQGTEAYPVHEPTDHGEGTIYDTPTEPLPPITLIPTQPPTEPTEPDVTPAPDRTPQILYALSTATEPDTARIIDYYDFTLVTSMRHVTGMLLRFYVTNEGSGEILIGTAMHEDGGGWHMVFRHFEDGTAPTDMLELIGFMELL